MRKFVGDARSARAGQARRAAAGGERQRGAARRSRREPDDGGRSCEGHPRVQREEPAAPRRQLPPRAALRSRQRVHAHPPRRHADGGGGGRAERRLVLVRTARGAGDAGRLPGGADRWGASSSTCRAGQARPGHRDQDADPAPDGDRLPPDPPGEPIPRDIIPFVCPWNGEECFAPTCIPPSPPTRSSHSTRSPPRAARSPSPGPATTGSRRPRRRTIAVE